MDRKTELELKKAKLEQMRKEKAQKMMVVHQQPSSTFHFNQIIKFVFPRPRPSQPHHRPTASQALTHSMWTRTRY